MRAHSVAIGLTFAITGLAFAQPRPVGGIALEDRIAFQPGQNLGGGEIVLAERRVVTALDRAAELLKAENYADAVTLLQSVIDNGGDAFYQPEGGAKSVYLSVRTEATRLIGSIPREQRRGTYDLEFGPVAKTLLEEAAGDPVKLSAVARRFLHTESGAEAQYRVGLWHMDHGRWFAAATCLDRLAELPEAANRYEPLLSVRRFVSHVGTGDDSRADELAKEIVERFGDREIRLAGETVRLDMAGERSPFTVVRNAVRSGTPGGSNLEDWTTVRGGPNRLGLVTLEPVPAEPNPWSVSTIVDPFRENLEDTTATALTRAFESAIDRLEGAGSLPAGQPVVVGDRVVVRTLANIRVLDRATGETVTEFLLDRSLEDLGGYDSEVAAANGELPNYVRQRVFDDANQGSFSADAERVYAVEDVGRYSRPQRASRVSAYDIETGRLRWQVGGPPGDFETPLAGTFFLGPPLPLGGRLYVLAEVENEVRLLVLEPRTEQGRERVDLVWSQPLVAPNLDLTAATDRRTTGLVVTHADGVLVCPTGTGIYVAVDAFQQTLMWAREFEPTGPGVLPIPFPVPVPNPKPNPNGNGDWRDDVVIASGGRVLLTPRTSNAVFCVDLRTGKDLWEKPAKRGDGLYLAGVSGDTAVVVGAKSVRAINLVDGTSPWKTSAKLPVPPAGRGFLVPSHALVPLTSNRIAFVELATGNVTSTEEVRKGVDLGNLVPAGDRVVSQGTRSVDLLNVEVPKVSDE